jgi:hypothetical protein
MLTLGTMHGIFSIAEPTSQLNSENLIISSLLENLIVLEKVARCASPMAK